VKKFLVTLLFAALAGPAFAAPIMRPKRDDSINPIIGKNRQLFQCLHACSALREAGCGFYAASFAVSG